MHQKTKRFLVFSGDIKWNIFWMSNVWSISVLILGGRNILWSVIAIFVTQFKNIYKQLFVARSLHKLQLFSWQRPLSCRNQLIDLQRKSMDWFLYDRDLHYKRVTASIIEFPILPFSGVPEFPSSIPIFEKGNFIFNYFISKHQIHCKSKI